MLACTIASVATMSLIEDGEGGSSSGVDGPLIGPV